MTPSAKVTAILHIYNEEYKIITLFLKRCIIISIIQACWSAVVLLQWLAALQLLQMWSTAAGQRSASSPRSQLRSQLRSHLRSQLRSPRSSDPESESDPAAEAAAAILGETGFNIHPGTRGLAAFQQQRGGGTVLSILFIFK